MGIAPVAYTLWQRFLRFDPADPIWPNRDRFVLSEGHASALLWSLLHLTGVRAVDPDYEVLGRRAVTLDDLKTFRQLDSHCPGHPEVPPGRAVSRRRPVRSARASRRRSAWRSPGQWLAARYNRDGFPLFDFDVYALAGDGCMMEGISSEAASLAGHQRLSNLCWIYDSNRVTIEGHTGITFTEDVAARFLAYGWNVTTVADANDLDAVAGRCTPSGPRHDRPTLMVVHSHIGYGSPVEDTPKAHGDAARARGRPGGQAVLRPARGHRLLRPRRGLRLVRTRHRRARRPRQAAWEGSFKAYRDAYPRLWPTSSTASSAGSSRTAGRRPCPRSRRTRRASPPVTPPAAC